MTTHELLNAVEALIVAERRLTGRKNEVLCEVAADLRGRLSEAPCMAMLYLDQRLQAMKRSKTAIGYSEGTMMGVAQELLHRWPVVKQALERFGAKIEEAQPEPMDAAQ